MKIVGEPSPQAVPVGPSAPWVHRPMRFLAVGLFVLGAVAVWQRVRRPGEDLLACPVPVEVEGVVTCTRQQLVRRLGRVGCRPGPRVSLRPGARVLCRRGRLILGRMSAGRQRLLGVPVDLNRAELEDLVSLPGIGPRLAARILAYRRRQGCFHSLREVLLVSGLGLHVLERISRRARIGPCRSATGRRL